MEFKKYSHALVLIVVAAIIAIPSLNYFGICLKNFRVVTKEEQIDSAIEYTIFRMDRYVRLVDENGRVSLRIPQGVRRYKSISEFKLRNPGCCNVSRRGEDGYTPGLFQRLLGRYCATVHVTYDVEYQHEGRWLRSQQERNVAMTNCAKPWSGRLR